MTLPILAVDSNTNAAYSAKSLWESIGIHTALVMSMQDALELLSKDKFLFVGINGDSINYLPLLRITRSMARAIPILVNSSKISVIEYIAAMRNSADIYTDFMADPKKHVELALASVERFIERRQYMEKPSEFIIFKYLFISLTYRQVFCCDKEIKLSKTEYDLLLLFLNNKGKVLSHNYIYSSLYNDYSSANLAEQAVWSLVKRLRNKIRLDLRTADHIQTVHKVGYKLLINR
jgi:DNA-binding response OmpR family regulator